MALTAMREATSPWLWPPMPSATTNMRWSGSMPKQSSLWVRARPTSESPQALTRSIIPLCRPPDPSPAPYRPVTSLDLASFGPAEEAAEQPSLALALERVERGAYLGVFAAPSYRLAEIVCRLVALAGAQEDLSCQLVVLDLHRLELHGAGDRRRGARHPALLLHAGARQVVPGEGVGGVGLGGTGEVVGRLDEVLPLVGLHPALHEDAAELAGVGLVGGGAGELDVVQAPALGVGQHVERLGDRLEGELGLLLLGAVETVGVPLAGELEEAVLDLLAGGVARHPQDAVEVRRHCLVGGPRVRRILPYRDGPPSGARRRGGCGPWPSAAGRAPRAGSSAAGRR